MSKAWLAVVVVLGGAAAAEPAPSPLAQALAQARAAGEPVLIDVYTDWCKPCAELERSVFPRPEFQKAVKGYRFLRYDAEKGPGVEVAQKYSVKGFPTLLILSNDGAELSRRAGSADAAALVAWLDQARPLAMVVDVSEARLAREPNNAALLIVAARKAAAQKPMDTAKVEALYGRAIRADSGNRQGVASQAALALARIQAKRSAELEQGRLLLELVQEFPASGEGLQALRGLGALDGANRPAHDKLAAAGRQACAAAATPGQLNELLYALFDLGLATPALECARKLQALKPGPELLDSVAEAYFQAGDTKKALEIERSLPSQLDMVRQQIARFESGKRELPPEPHVNPLVPEEASAPSAGPPADHLAFFGRVREAAVGSCRDAPHSEPASFLRLYVAGGKVTRALLLEPEASRALKTCMEGAVASLEVPASIHGPSVTVPIQFPLKREEPKSALPGGRP